MTRASAKESFIHTIRRWMRSRLQRKYEWQFNRFYWVIQRRWNLVRFGFGKFALKSQNWVNFGQESVSIFGSLMRTILGQVLFAFTLAFGLYILDNLVLHYGQIIKFFPPQVEAIYRLAIQKVDPQASVSYLSTLAQIAGVFLALYFTAVSVVASTAYARIHGDVRAVMINEKAGNLYLRVVALLAADATLLLAADAIGHPPGFLNLFVITGLGIFSIYSFVVLGTRTFDFFDPTRLTDYLAYDISKLIRSATCSGFGWQDPSFQAHYQRIAEARLETYRNLVFLANREEYLQGKGLATLGVRACGLMELYAQKKPRIPSDSHWFEQTNRHRSWLISDYSQVSMALQTATRLDPEVVANPFWFEEKIENIIEESLRGFLNRSDFNNAIQLGHTLLRTQNNLSKHFGVKESLRLNRLIRPLILQYAQNKEQPLDGFDLNLVLGIIEVCGRGLINILLGLSKSFENLNTESFGTQISNIQWNNPKTIFSQEMPREVIEQLEYLQEGLRFEYAAEGHPVSPLWYQQQLAALGFVRFLTTAIEALLGELESSFPTETEVLIENKRHLFAAELIHNGLESCEKFIYHFGIFRQCFDQLVPFRKVSDMPWPTIDWEGFNQRINATRERLIVALAHLSLTLATLPHSKELPDYFGEAYSVLAQECYAAMALGKEQYFEKVFPSFFLVALTAHGRLQGELRDYNEKTKLVFSTEPIIDLLALSGYGLIYSELDSKTYWDVVKNLWEKCINNRNDPRQFLEYIRAITAYRRSLFALAPREILRTGWKQDSERRLRARGLLEEDLFYRYHYSKTTVTRHPSAIIRALTRGSDLYYDAQDVFIVVYLMKRPEATGLEFSVRSGGFADALQKEYAGDDTDE